MGARWPQNDEAVQLGGRRALAGLLAVAMVFGLMNINPPEAKAEAADDYKKEQQARQEEYKKKFDLETLTWRDNSARPYLYWRNDVFGGIVGKNYIHVYAFEGETICFGSNIYNSKLNMAGDREATEEEKKEIKKRLGYDEADDTVDTDISVDIVLTDLRGNRILYDVKQNGLGHIPNVQTEVLAKTLESPNGQSQGTYNYTPLTYKVTETGVYTFEFHSYDLSGTDGQSYKNISNFYSQSATRNENAQGALVAAWDVSVFNEQGYKKTGRVYADYLALQENGGEVRETYYVVTTDSYIYRWDWKGVKPNTYSFFADNRGLTDNATGSTLYKSVKEENNGTSNFKKFGASYKYPGSVNTDQAKSFYIFFEMPNADLNGHLYSRAIQPDPAENIRFVDTITDDEGKEVPGSYVGMGGYFAFDTREATTATLVLKFDEVTIGGTKGDYAPVTISGPVKPYSTNYFYWDGRDGKGTVIPEGDYKIEDLITLTTKAGEIHFPVHDVETSVNGFTFTRVSPIYNRAGEQISDLGDGNENILDATKSVIYYDDSAIYYGEHVGRTGLMESAVDRFENNTDNLKTVDDIGNPYYKYVNMNTDGGEYEARQTDYIRNNISAVKAGTANYIRIGDHSHTTNLVEYYDNDGAFLKDYESQKDKIDYLDSEQYPVGISSVSEKNTYDFGISDFWTFIPAEPAVIEDSAQTIRIIDGDAFNLTGQVFYDKNSNGKYDSMADSDSLLTGVTLNLYTKTADDEPITGSTYYTVDSVSGKVNSGDSIGMQRNVVRKFTGTAFDPEKTYYELFKSDVTPVEGRYFFTNIPYDKAKGTEVVYEVCRPDASYVLTSGNTLPEPIKTTGDTYYGSYALYAYDTAGRGTEVQIIRVGEGEGMVNPDSNRTDGETNHTVTAVDVGYHYDAYTKLKLKKTYAVNGSVSLPQTTVFEVCYVDSAGTSHVYDELPLARIENEEYTYELLPSTMNGAEVTDWYTAAEYYIAAVDTKNYLFRHTFDYDPSSGTYISFVGESQYIELSDLNGDNILDQKDIPDANADETHDWKDLSVLGTDADMTETTWEKTGTGISAPFHAVLDRNPGTAEITINITNASDPGVIEILKYTGALEDRNYLQGATFRIYTSLAGESEITIDAVQQRISGNTADDLQWLSDRQVGSSSTRANGKVAFAGLDPNKHYVIREMFAPAGYRIMETLYLVHPKNTPNNEYYREKPEGMTDEDWEDWKMRNFLFGEDNYVQAAIANIPANGDMAIRKQIDGRAWNEGDQFTFDIAFRQSNTDGTLITDITEGVFDSSSGFFVMDDTEKSLFGDNGSRQKILADLKEFVSGFNNNTNDITVNYHSQFATSVTSVNGAADIETPMADTKQSVGLITSYTVKEEKPDDPDEDQEEHPDDASLNRSTQGTIGGAQAVEPHVFPAAGIYTFTVSENDLGGELSGTLSKSNRVFVVEIEVTRVLDPGEDEGIPITAENSYLKAEVRNIYSRDPKEGAASPAYPTDYNSMRRYAGVAPTFVNTYTIQPAIQTTSYAITKIFTGRLGQNGQPVNDEDDVKRNWLANDKFTVTITGANDQTVEALKSSQLYIGGLHGGMEGGTFAEKKEIDFNQNNVTNRNSMAEGGQNHEVDKGHTFNFEEIDFHDIKFPVVWKFNAECTVDGVNYKAGDIVPDASKVVFIPAAEGSGGRYIYAEDPENVRGSEPEVSSHTGDLVYTLRVEETKPQGASPENEYTFEGVKYDPKVYTMVITLRNAVAADTEHPSAGVHDGIIDEMDFELYECAPDHIHAEGVEPIATCETDQEVVTTFDDWVNAVFENGSYESDEGAFEGADDSWKNGWYYVNAEQIIRQATVEEWQDDNEDYQKGKPEVLSVMAANSGQAGAGEQKIYIVRDATAQNAYKVEHPDAGLVYTFDELEEYNLTFVVKREGHHGVSNHTMTFANTYSASGTWTPTVAKTLAGRDWEIGEEFEFTLSCTKWPGSGNDYNPVPDQRRLRISRPISGTENSAVFDTVTFTAPGEYEFRISEIGKGQGIGSGTSTGDINIEVTVSDDGNGSLNLTVTGSGGTTPGEPSNHVATTIHFVNTYDENGEFELNLSKQLTGRDWRTDDEFIFSVKPDNGRTEEDIANGTLIVPDSWIISGSDYTVKVDNNSPGTKNDAAGWETKTLNLGKLHVGNLKTLGAEYKFTIAEDTRSFDDQSIYCAQPSMELTLAVSSTPHTEGGLTGDLEFVATYAYLSDPDTKYGDSANPEGSITLPFTNRYYASASPSENNSRLTIGKVLTGREWLSDESYDVELTLNETGGNGKAENVQYIAYTGAATPGNAYREFSEVKDRTLSLTFDGTGAEDPDNWNVDFRFYEAGDYVFTVREASPANGSRKANVICDDTEYTVTFSVTKDESNDNRLQVSRSVTSGSGAAGTAGGSADIVFINRYEPEPAVWTPSVTKELKGRDWVANDSFTFTLERTDGSTDGVTLAKEQCFYYERVGGRKRRQFRRCYLH